MGCGLYHKTVRGNGNIMDEKAVHNQEDLVTRVKDCLGEQSLEKCLTCKLCESRCHLLDEYPDWDPKTVIGRVFNGEMEQVADSEFIWACTLCARCTTACPIKLNMGEVLRRVRGLARLRGNSPERLEEGLQKVGEIGNSVGMDTEEFVESIEWLAEEAVEEIDGVDEDEYELPVDREGAEILYIPNPREFTSNPHLFEVYLKFFIAAGLDWTYSSKLCDISNWGYYMGDEQAKLMLVRNVVDRAKDLGVKTVLSTECGHGFKVLKKDAEAIIGEPLGFEVTSVVELAHRLWKEGRLKLRENAIDKRVTYHDSCNLGRKLGIFEPPRELLKYICTDFVDMVPNCQDSLCCGGGGLVNQNTDMGAMRMKVPVHKREVILETQAEILATACQACQAQLIDLQEKHEMPLEVKSVMQLVAEAI
jgi:Fe-S oxidoreductase